ARVAVSGSRAGRRVVALRAALRQELCRLGLARPSRRRAVRARSGGSRTGLRARTRGKADDRSRRRAGGLRRAARRKGGAMDLTFDQRELEFRDELRAWLGDNPPGDAPKDDEDSHYAWR